MSSTVVIDPLVRATHDELLAKLPEGTQHDSDGCPVCTAALIQEEASVTKTDAEIQADIAKAVADATGPLLSELETLRESQSAAAQEAKLAEVREPLEARIAELDAEKDVLTNSLAAAEARWTEAETFLTEAAAAAEQTAAIEARRTEREAKVKEVASFKDDYYTDAKRDQWAAMADEAFDDLVAQLTETAAAAGTRRATVTPPSALTAKDAGKTTGGTSALQTALNLRNRGISPTRV